MYFPPQPFANFIVRVKSPMQNVTLTPLRNPFRTICLSRTSVVHASHFSSQFFVIFRHPNILTSVTTTKDFEQGRRTLGQLFLAPITSIFLAECSRENEFPSLLACTFLGRLLSHSYFTVVHYHLSIGSAPTINCPTFTSQLYIIQPSHTLPIATSARNSL